MSDDEASVHDNPFEGADEGNGNEQNDNVLRKCKDLVKIFALNRLKASIREVCGKDIDLTNWDVFIIKRISGVTQGIIEIDYGSPEGKRFRNRAEVSAHFGLTPAVRKNIRAMTKEQLFLSAMEYRERILLSQQLGLHGFACESIDYRDGEIILSPPIEDKGFFAIGNTTILSWGKIITAPGFHTSTHIFPIGFCCVRLEHDLIMNTLVDCLCEVDGICTLSSGETVLYSSMPEDQIQSFEDNVKSVEALFRISVQWHLANGAKTVKVYETTRSPQHAWQAAALESLGANDDNIPPSLILTRADGTVEHSRRCEEVARIGSGAQRCGAVCPVDTEEFALRSKVRESRRAYFRAIRSEQVKGGKVALKTRLSPDHHDSFMDDAVMRLIEGMEGASSCDGYVFFEARERETGVKVMWKEYGHMQKKAKLLDQILRQHALQTEQKHLFSARKRKAEEDPGDEMDTKEMRALVQAALKARNNKARDIEKSVTSIKTILAKTLRKRKDDAKSAVERNIQLADQPVAPAVVPVVVTSGCQRPEPAEGSIFMPHGLFSELLEIWVYLNSLSPQEAVIPPLESFQSALLDTNGVLGGLRRRLGQAVSKITAYSSPAAILDSVGIELTKQLMFDFEKGMGIDMAEPQLGNLRIPVNELTWREIARIAMLIRLSKEMGLSENEITPLIKGRGYSTSPDSLDRKALKLARRRILFTFSSRHEVQETACGFRTGLVIRIPAPSALKTNPLRYWLLMKQVLQSLQEQDMWMVPWILRYCLVVAQSSSSTWVVPHLEDLIRDCSALYRDANLSRDAAKLRADALIESCLGDCAALRGDKSTNESPVPMVDMSSSSLVQTVRQQLLRCYNSDLMKETATSVDIDNEEEELLNHPEDAMDVDISMNNGAPSSGANCAAAVEDDSVAVGQLPLCMQRCYLVVRALMEHAEGAILSDIIPSTASGYRRRARYALTLKDIRKYLVAGGYGQQLTRFYYDIHQVIETAYICSLDNVVNRGTILRMTSIFERLFFEMVICYDHPLLFHDCCHFCRTQESVPAARAAVCDRCEGIYHIECLDPPLTMPPRSEWTCPACVEQCSVAQAHPLRTAKVRHPQDGRIGEVVGIEQMRQEMVFIIDFGTSRETYPCRKVRAWAVIDDKEPSAYELPEGYTIEEYDSVCGLIRAYCGCCSPLLSTPGILVDQYCKPAAQLLERDADFAMVREAISLLSSAEAQSDELQTDDWLVIFKSLINHALRSSYNTVPMPTADEQDTIVLSLLDALNGETKARRDETGDLMNGEEEDDDNISLDRMVKRRKLVKRSPALTSPTSEMESSSGHNDSQSFSDDDDGDSDNSSLHSVSVDGADDEGAEDDFAALYEDREEGDSDGEETGNPVTQWLWRLKGREDALYCYSIILEAIESLDLEYKSGLELEESQPLVRQQLGDFWPHAMAAVVKSCVCRAPESEIEHWGAGWDAKMSALLDPTRDSCPLCELCGSTEEYLCSPFVRMPADLSMVTTIEKVVLWPFVDGNAADSTSRGKLVHSFCADSYFALKNKKSKLLHSSGDLGVVERLCVLNWPSKVVLGMDRDKSNYWVFPHCPAVFVQSIQDVSGEERHFWSIYRSEADKAALTSWLSSIHPREALLKRTIKHALSHCSAATSSLTMSVATSNVATTIKKRPDARFEVGDIVCVMNDGVNPLYWSAEVLEVQFVGDKWVYRVLILDWPEKDEVFMAENQLMSESEALKKANSSSLVSSSSGALTSLDALGLSAHKAHLAKNVFTAPSVLHTLQARSFINLTDRACGQRPPMGFSSCSSMLEQLRTAMLIIEAALPMGAVDDSEERWAEDFVVPWREAVLLAADPTSLMQCQLMLEYGIRTAWLKPTGLKMLSCLPSRFNCLRNATYGMVAIRVWVLDSTIKYDKVDNGNKSNGSLLSANAKKKKR